MSALDRKTQEMKARLDNLFEMHMINGLVPLDTLREVMAATVRQASTCNIPPDQVAARVKERQADDLMVYKQIVRNHARRPDGRGYPDFVEHMILSVLLSVCAGCSEEDVADARKELRVRV